VSRASPLKTACRRQLRGPLPRAAFALILLALASAAAADVVILVNGDRLSGHVVGATPRRVRFQTRYGTLVLPREQVARLEYDDGRVELVTVPATPAPVLPPPTSSPEPARLQIAVTGASFWQAWDPKTAPADPSLRLELRLDDAPLVSYTDSTLDPEDLPKAVVNSFVFSPEALAVRAGPGVVVAPPIVVGGEIGLALSIPAQAAGSHQLRLAYQLNEGSASEPLWRNLASATAQVVVTPGETLKLRLEQSRGAMEYSRHRMLNVETFNVVLWRQDDAPASP
jgi:hypothetical protein